jgi:hypothetical protein
MNQPADMTAAVIEFLTQPGSDFGTQPTDIEALRSVEALAGELRLRIETLSPEPTDTKKAIGTATDGEVAERQHLHQILRDGDLKSVDWLRVMQELRIRLRLTDGFFSQDLASPESSV